MTNYVVKGALGSLLICTLFPLACIVVSYTSLLLALLAPLLIPCASLLLHLTAALVYDWETGRPTAALLPSLIVHLLLQGDDDDDGGYPAYSHHDRFPPWWDFVCDDYGGNLSGDKFPP